MRIEAAAQLERWTLWPSVAFGLGSALYFGLANEPSLALLLGGAVVLAVVAIGAQARGWPRNRAAAMALMAFCAAGFAGAALKTTLVASPRIPAGLGPVRVEGRVVDLASPSKARRRLLIAPESISRLGEDDLPRRIRLVMNDVAGIAPGDRVRLTAILNPPPGPASPGAYDFARDAYFEGLGGVGAALGPVQVEPDDQGLDLETWLNRLRWRTAERLVSALPPGDAAGLAAAVATSHEDWLSPEAEDDLRGSGLAHMLAIAGLHTAAVSGFAYGLLRLLAAAIPALALRVSGKKLAAAGGLVAVGLYFMLSGAHAPARRAAITASVAFLAILLDRRPVSLQSLSLAALVVLILQPEAVTQPGFQMSFCATGALVALAEAWPRRAAKAVGLPWPLALLQRSGDILKSLLAVSFVAGLATGPFAIQHFNRSATFGLFANLFADFIASAVMMPALAVTLAGQGAGASDLVLAPVLATLRWAAEGVLAVARFFARAPMAQTAIASAPALALVLSMGGLVFAILWRGRLRWIGVGLSLAVLVWPRSPSPVMWVAADSGNAAVIERGVGIAMKPNKRAFAVGAFLQHRGLAAPTDSEAASAKMFDCFRSYCLTRSGFSPRLALWFGAHAPTQNELTSLCQRIDFIALAVAVDELKSCNAIWFDRRAFDLGGALEIYRQGDGYRLAWAALKQRERPWGSP
jgi:competence protein ComEC